MGGAAASLLKELAEGTDERAENTECDSQGQHLQQTYRKESNLDLDPSLAVSLRPLVAPSGLLLQYVTQCSSPTKTGFYCCRAGFS